MATSSCCCSGVSKGCWLLCLHLHNRGWSRAHLTASPVDEDDHDDDDDSDDEDVDDDDDDDNEDDDDDDDDDDDNP